MKITKLECTAIAVTLVLVALVTGFFLGQNATDVTTVHATPEPSDAVTAVLSPSPAHSDAAKQVSVELQDSTLAPVAEEITYPIALNSATVEQLIALPGIGEVLAQRILDYRESIGGFSAVEELLNVEGIGEKKLDAMINLIEVGNEYENSGG